MHAQGRDKMYDHFGACGVDPRNLAQRIMEVRVNLLSLVFISIWDSADSADSAVLLYWLMIWPLC